jgi:hypothetical protein
MSAPLLELVPQLVVLQPLLEPQPQEQLLVSPVFMMILLSRVWLLLAGNIGLIFGWACVPVAPKISVAGDGGDGGDGAGTAGSMDSIQLPLRNLTSLPFCSIRTL